MTVFSTRNFCFFIFSLMHVICLTLGGNMIFCEKKRSLFQKIRLYEWDDVILRHWYDVSWGMSEERIEILIKLTLKFMAADSVECRMINCGSYVIKFWVFQNHEIFHSCKTSVRCVYYCRKGKRKYWFKHKIAWQIQTNF